MIDEANVRLGTEYLDQCIKHQKSATLVEMHAYIDARNKSIPTLEEVNETLRQHPDLFVHRTTEGIEFGLTGTERSITEEDLKQSYAKYHEEFWIEYERLQAKKKSGASS